MTFVITALFWSTHSLVPFYWGLVVCPIFPLVVHQPAFPSIWPAIPSLQWGLSTHPGVTTWCVCVCSWRVNMSCVWVLQRGHSGDGCDLASTLCRHDLRKGDLFVLSWARVRRVRRGSISSKLIMCGGGVGNILSLPPVARCLETINVCIWRRLFLCLL